MPAMETDARSRHTGGAEVSAAGGAPEPRRGGLTLGQVFGLGAGALAALLAVLFSFVLASSRRSLVESAEQLERARSERIAARVESRLYEAESAVRHVENRIRYGACRPDDVASVEEHLFAEVLDNEELAEATLTHGASVGRDDDGALRLAPRGRWQVSVYRESAAPDGAILTRIVVPAGRGFVARVRRRPARGALHDGAFEPATGPPPGDPTDHATFTTPASAAFYGQVLWSDLSYTQIDAHLPEPRRRVVVTVMRAVEDGHGRFAGVVRVGRLLRQIDAAVAPRSPDDPERAFLCDDRGRLITRLADGDALHDDGVDLRVVPRAMPPEVAAALARRESGMFTLGGRRYLARFHPLRGAGGASEGTQDWRVGIVVPEDRLPGVAELQRSRRALLVGALGLMALILAGGFVTLRAARRGLGQIVDSAARLREFDFSPSTARSSFRDIHAAADSLELAKTAMRALSKYVPVGLVRRLYQTGREPALGAEPCDVTLMFTDLEGFTTLAEATPPDELARLLGRYLEVMTTAVHATGGIIDKYIGDALMALWNVPAPLEGHAARACHAALRCVAAAEALFSSPEWAERPRLRTRFGLHRARVMVGHFGAPDRLSYTALGDGVNLAARLEGLNKLYGTTALVSEALRDAAGDAFAWRLLDRVAVKGKTQGVRIYELRGPAGTPLAACVTAYEDALAAHWRRDFAAALGLLAPHVASDPPSAALAERCRRLLADAPPPDWDGVFTASVK
jgi:adenylate cyclase